MTETLETLVESVEASTRTLSIVNFDGAPVERDRIVSYFEPQSVAVREGVSAEALPRNVAVLHDGDEFVAAADIADLYRHVSGDAYVGDAFAAAERPALLEHVDDRTFTSYDLHRMLLASHEIERYAVRVGEGDAGVPAGLIEHASDADEILGSWFVVFTTDRSPEDTRALVSVETGDREFSGFWTYENGVVEDVLARLRAEYPPTNEAATPREADD